MNARARRKRSRLRWVLVLLGLLALVAIALIVALVVMLLPGTPELPIRPGPETTEPTERPDAQAADCPDVLTLVMPGTWESSADDDPYNPTANPHSLMLQVTDPLEQQFDPARNSVYTVPYVAQFRNPTNLADRQADYDFSRGQGYERAVEQLVSTHDRCPLTRYLFLGFSQGAVIAGDLASNIGNGRGPIPEADADLVLGVGLIADGRRETGQQNDVGPSPDGVGAEVALGGFRGIVPGITMTGPRSGGFGSLSERVYSVCARGDLICDSPTINNPLRAVSQLIGAVNNPVHALYASPQNWSHEGESATQWMSGWAAGVIEEAPHPAHY